MPLETVLGVVLAGGASRRMGFDKCAIEIGGRTLLARATDTLTQCCDEVVISVQPGLTFEYPEVRTISDRRAGSGPLAGVEAALAEARAAGFGSTFVMACDLPHVDSEIVAGLLVRSAEDPLHLAAVPSLNGRRQPLCAVYRTAALDAVRRQLDAGQRSMRSLLEVIPVLDVALDSQAPRVREDLFLNINRPADIPVSPTLDRS